MLSVPYYGVYLYVVLVGSSLCLLLGSVLVVMVCMIEKLTLSLAMIGC